MTATMEQASSGIPEPAARTIGTPRHRHRVSTATVVIVLLFVVSSAYDVLLVANAIEPSCFAKVADVSIVNSTFDSMVGPPLFATQYILKPGTAALLTVSYSSPTNLTELMTGTGGSAASFLKGVGWNGTIEDFSGWGRGTYIPIPEAGVGFNVTDVSSLGDHEIVATYVFSSSSGARSGTYALPLLGTCSEYFVTVGEWAYPGPLGPSPQMITLILPFLLSALASICLCIGRILYERRPLAIYAEHRQPSAL